MSEATNVRVWVDGRCYADAREAKVSAIDHGLVAGDGVFETLKIEPWGAFAMTRHLRRLAASARTLGLPEPDEAAIREGTAAVLAERDFDFGRLRITWTGGPGPLSSAEPYGPPTLVVAAEATARTVEPGRLVTVDWTRNLDDPLVGVKSTSYGGNVRALAYAHQRGASEAIFRNNRGEVCEGSGTNIFFIFGTEVVSPTLAAGPLAGITRALIIEQTGAIEKDLSLEEARQADEVFLTSSLRDVNPVAVWDDRRWSVTPRASAIAQEFARRSRADPDPV